MEKKPPTIKKMEPQQHWSAKAPMFSKAIFIGMLNLRLCLGSPNSFFGIDIARLPDTATTGFFVVSPQLELTREFHQICSYNPVNMGFVLTSPCRQIVSWGLRGFLQSSVEPSVVWTLAEDPPHILKFWSLGFNSERSL